MKVACILGSPRPQGNSSTLARRFCAAAEEQGADVEIFTLNELRYRGCQNLFMCKTKLDRCGLDDDLTQVLDAVHTADIVLLATPIYFTDVSSQLKAFIDRTFSYFVPDYVTNPNKSRLSRGKRLVFIQTQGEPEHLCDDVFPRYERPFEMLGFTDRRLIRVCGVRQEGEVEGRPDVIKSVEELAKDLLGSLR